MIVAVATVAELRNAHNLGFALEFSDRQMACQIESDAAARTACQAKGDEHRARMFGFFDMRGEALQRGVEFALAQVVADRIDGLGKRPWYVLAGLRHREVFGQTRRRIARTVFLQRFAHRFEVAREAALVRQGQSDRFVLEAARVNAT